MAIHRRRKAQNTLFQLLRVFVAVGFSVSMLIMFFSGERFDPLLVLVFGMLSVCLVGQAEISHSVAQILRKLAEQEEPTGARRP